MYEIISIAHYDSPSSWLIVNQEMEVCAVVNPGEATSILATLNSRKLFLEAILVTSPHQANTETINLLRQEYPTPVYGPLHSALVDIPLSTGQRVYLANVDIELYIIQLTPTQIAYTNSTLIFPGPLSREITEKIEKMSGNILVYPSTGVCKTIDALRKERPQEISTAETAYIPKAFLR